MLWLRQKASNRVVVTELNNRLGDVSSADFAQFVRKEMRVLKPTNKLTVSSRKYSGGRSRLETSRSLLNEMLRRAVTLNYLSFPLKVTVAFEDGHDDCTFVIDAIAANTLVEVPPGSNSSIALGFIIEDSKGQRVLVMGSLKAHNRSMLSKHCGNTPCSPFKSTLAKRLKPSKSFLKEMLLTALNLNHLNCPLKGTVTFKDEAEDFSFIFGLNIALNVLAETPFAFNKSIALGFAFENSKGQRVLVMGPTKAHDRSPAEGK